MMLLLYVRGFRTFGIFVLDFNDNQDMATQWRDIVVKLLLFSLGKDIEDWKSNEFIYMFYSQVGL